MGFENGFEKEPTRDIENPKCPDCQGSGKVKETDGKYITCKRCKGTGIKPFGGGYKKATGSVLEMGNRLTGRN